MAGRLNAMASSSSGVQTLVRIMVEAFGKFRRIREVIEAAPQLNELGDGDLVAVGNAWTYFETGSSKLSFPSWTSCTMTAAVIVLVFEARGSGYRRAAGLWRPVQSCRSRKRRCLAGS